MEKTGNLKKCVHMIDYMNSTWFSKLRQVALIEIYFVNSGLIESIQLYNAFQK